MYTAIVTLIELLLVAGIAAFSAHFVVREGKNLQAETETETGNGVIAGSRVASQNG